MQAAHRTVGPKTVTLLRKDNTVVSPTEVRNFCHFFAGELPEHAELYYKTLFNLGVTGKSVEELLKICAPTAWVEALLITCREYTGVDRFVVSVLTSK